MMSAKNTTLTQERLKELVEYDAETGIFTRRVSKGRAKIGNTAGYPDTYGHMGFEIEYIRYLSHRLVWLYVHGRWPVDQLDHINGVRHDNRIINLRECSQLENHQNRQLSSNSTSGLTGVCLEEKKQKWRAYISYNGKRYNLGHFPTKEAAYAAYLKAKTELHTFQPTPRDA